MPVAGERAPLSEHQDQLRFRVNVQQLLNTAFKFLRFGEALVQRVTFRVILIFGVWMAPEFIS
jgi:hypothetical protein